MQTQTSAGDVHSKGSIKSAISSHLIFAFIFSALVNTLFLASPLYMMQLYGRVLDSRSLETLASLSIALVLALIAMAAADAARGRILARAAVRMERRFANQNVDSATGYERRLTDLGIVRNFLSGNTATTLLDTPFTILFLLVLFLLHPMLGLVATFGAAIILAAVAIARFANREQDRQVQMGQTGLEGFSRVLDRDTGDMRVLGVEAGLTARLVARMSDVRGLRQKSFEKTASLGAFNRFVRMAAHSAALATGAILTLRGDLAPAAMLAAAILAGRALGPIESLPGALRQASATRGALERLNTQRPVQITPPPAQIENRTAAISISRATILRKGARSASLRNVTIEIADGEVIAVTGTTGSGKSTLARALAGIDPLNSGQLHVAGNDPAQMDDQRRAALIGWMPQDVTLYPGTVADNIARFTDAPPAEYIAAAERAGARGLIEKLPNGFATQVDPGGQNLSPGLRQRVALARALIGQPALVILDQPTSHMDAQGEVATLNAIRALKDAGVTVVVISHKPVLAALADKILVMKDGSVALFEDREKVINAMRTQSLTPVTAPNMPSQEKPRKKATL